MIDGLESSKQVTSLQPSSILHDTPPPFDTTSDDDTPPPFDTTSDDDTPPVDRMQIYDDGGTKQQSSMWIDNMLAGLLLVVAVIALILAVVGISWIITGGDK